LRTAISKQHGIPPERQRYFIDPELTLPIQGAAFTELAHGSTIYFHEAGELNGDCDEEVNGSSTNALNGAHDLHPQPPVAYESLSGSSASNLAPLLPMHGTSGYLDASLDSHEANRNSEVASVHPAPLDSRLGSVNDNEGDAVTHLPVRRRSFEMRQFFSFSINAYLVTSPICLIWPDNFQWLWNSASSRKSTIQLLRSPHDSACLQVLKTNSWYRFQDLIIAAICMSQQ